MSAPEIERVLARRAFVPSEREVELGQLDYAFEPPVVEEKAPRPPLRELAKTGLQQLDLRTLEASPLPLVLFGFLIMLAEADASGFNVLAPDVQRTFHSDLGFVVALTAILSITTTLFSPLAGYLSDRVNRVRLLFVGNLIQSGAQVFAGVAPSTGYMAATRAAGGLGSALTSPVALPLVTDFYPVRTRARSLSLLFVFVGLGATLGPPISGTLGSWLGWRTCFVVLGFMTLGVTLLILLLREPVRGEQDRLAQGATADVAAEEQKPVGWAEGWRAAASISSLRRMWYMTPFLAMAGTTLPSLFSVYFSHRFGVSASERGLLFGLSGGFGLIGLTSASTIADKIMATRPGRIFTLMGGLLVFNAVVMLVLVFSPWLWLSIVIQLPVTAAGFLLLPSLLSVISLVVPPRLRGFGMQTSAPWQLLGFLVILSLQSFTKGLGISGTFVVLAILFVLGSVVVAAGAPGVERDMRAARAASMADEIARQAREAGGNKILICKDVDVTYESSQVLFGVDFEMEEGEIVALLGTNGAGKSTLQRAIAGIQEASNGAIFFDGEDITHRPAYLNAADGIVFMPGGAAVFPTLTVRENLAASRWVHREAPDAAFEAGVESCLSLFPFLRERLDVQAGALSGGEQQMVALSQAFLMKPRLLMIDELSLGLAPGVVEQLLEVVRRINAEGTTVLLVEQSANVALTLARRAVFMEKGEIRFDGPTEELLGRSDLLRAVFLGGTGGGSATHSTATQSRHPVEENEGPVLEVRGISAAYGGRAALTDVSLSVEAGQVVGIIGPNGAGKTTLFDVISGYTAPTGGEVVIAGTQAGRLSPDARARLGLSRSFQNARLFPALTVRENIAVALETRLAVKSAAASMLWLPQVRKAESRISRRVEYLLDLLNLGAFGDKFVSELSTGSRRLVDVACIMAAEPRVLLLDEPSSGLAQSEVEVLGPVIRRLAKDAGCGVLVIEHDIPLVTKLSDHLHVLRLGRNFVDGRPAEVVAHPEVVAAYLGASESTIARSGDLTPAALLAAAGLTPSPA